MIDFQVLSPRGKTKLRRRPFQPGRTVQGRAGGGTGTWLYMVMHGCTWLYMKRMKRMFVRLVCEGYRQRQDHLESCIYPSNLLDLLLGLLLLLMFYEFTNTTTTINTCTHFSRTCRWRSCTLSWRPCWANTVRSGCWGTLCIRPLLFWPSMLTVWCVGVRCGCGGVASH